MAEYEIDPPVERKVKLILTTSELRELRSAMYNHDLEYTDAWDAIDAAFKALLDEA
jgi:hypothetical protein